MKGRGWFAILNFKVAIPVVFAVSLVAVFFVPQVLSQSASFDFASDVAPTETTTIKVMGIGSLNLEPDSVIIALEVYRPPTDDLSGVMEYQKSVADEITTALEEASQSPGDFEVTRHDSRVYINQPRTAVPDQSSYVVDFRFPVRVQYEKFDQLFSELSQEGFVVDDIAFIQAPVEGLTPTNTATVLVPSGTSIPGCEQDSLCYDPSELVVDSGTSVTWTNVDDAAHTITSGTPEGGPSGLFDSGLIMSNSAFSHVFYQPGEHHYFCIVHPWMIGKVTVSSEGDMTEPPKMTLFVEFDVFMQHNADSVQNALDFYQEKTEALASILENHEVDTEGIQQRPLRLDDRIRMFGEPVYFEGRDRLIVQTKPENVETVVEIAASKNARIDNIYSAYSDSVLDYVRPQLTQLALDDAKRNVMELIGESGLQIKGIRSIEINTSSMIDERYDGLIRSGVVLNADRSNQNLDRLYTKAEVVFEIGQ